MAGFCRRGLMRLSRTPLLLLLLLGLALALSAAPQEDEAEPSPSALDCAAGLDGAASRDCGAEESDEAELMRVSLLQGPVKFGPRPRVPLAAEPAEAEGRRSTAIEADGLVDTAASLATAAQADVARGAHGGLRATVEGAARQPSISEEEAAEEGAEAVTSFMQTDLEMQPSEAAVPLPNLTVPEPALVELGEGCTPGLRTISTHVQLETLRAVGMFPPRSPCIVDDQTAGGVGADAKAASLLEMAHTNYFPHLANRTVDRLIICGYILFYFVCIVYMWYKMVYPCKSGDRAVQYHLGRKVVTEQDVEEETWQKGCLGWLACSWASSWVARWGHSMDAALTKIKADELPQLGTREYQAFESGGVFKKLWQEELDQVGMEKAGVFGIIVKIWTKQLMLYLMAIAACQQCIAQLYAVALIEHGLKYFYWLQNEKNMYPDKDIPLAIPLLCVIALFSALPFLNCIFESVSNNVARRMDQKLSGALCIAVFEKAQRLPSSCLHPTISKDEETGAETEKPPQVDMMQLINYDINGNLIGSYFQLCFCFNSFIAVLVFTNMLWARLKCATLIAFGVAVPFIFLGGVVAGKMAGHGYHLQTVSDMRIRQLREVLWGIRVVKSYAWEDAVETSITDIRKKELTILETYWYYIGIAMGLAMTFPRVLTILALWGFSEMYGTHDVANIFVCMQLLGCLRASCEGVAASLAKAITLQPSLKRIELFLKMPEAPVLLPERKPDWVDMWPSPQVGAETSLALQGSFAWSEEGEPMLHDLNLSVKKGEMLAVLGKVGAGKSTLLQAILGELYPDLSKKTLLSRPEVIAYSSQVPHIGEGTLRDNVLFGQEYDAVRYNEAIAGASLESDLKVLPGGDGVCIGSRGITLSGGQKARVSLARAAYHKGSEVLLIDDPFGAVDAPTAMTLLNKLLLGPLMEGRTRVVVLQPDAERLRLFDRVAIMEHGRIVEQGTPEEIMKTIAYQNLLSTGASRQFISAEGDADAPKPIVAAAAAGGKKEDNRAMRVKLREEDFEGRPTWEMIKQYCRIGRWRNIINTSLVYGIQVFVWLLADLSLASWTNAIAAKSNTSDRAYIFAYLFWLSLGVFSWLIVWKFGMWFTLRISAQIMNGMLTKLMRAPVDKFFDKHPIGRIMNRMVADVSTVDFSLFLRSTGSIATVYQTLLPLLYIHFIIPWFITVLALPVYYVIWMLCGRYWNTTVPLRYCATNCRSDVNSLVADVSSNNTVIRAYGDQERITRDMCDALDNQVKASLYGERILRRWLVNRILFLWSFYMSTTYMVGMLNTKWMGAGTLGLCLSNLMLIEALLEPNLDHATGAQLEFIALARIHEYMNIPQEKPRVMEGDAKYRSFLVKVNRADLGKLKSVGQGSSVEVYRDGQQILQASPGGLGLTAASGQACGLQDLCPSCAKLKETDAWHHIIGVNDAIRDVDLMVSELCGDGGEKVLLEVQSGWLAEGARVVIENLKAGYADIPRDVLKGVNITFEPRHKVSIVGTTGCGKSSLLLVLLRLLEPRAGRVLLNGVDTRDVGLATLRQSLGLVPQDPVLFSGTLKHNLDPFGHYSDGRLWKALALTHMADVVRGWDSQLNYQISEEGNNLSFGQRQLICLARMVLRQPPLLLLDEATSAIDPRTQEEVQNTIITAFPNSTLVAIAHRLETILDFDYVCVMERGEVVEEGSVKEVSQRKGGRLRSMLEAKRVW